MSKSLILAEKKEVGVQIICSLYGLDWEKELKNVKGGFFEHKNHVASWAMGHLFVNKLPKDVDATWGLFHILDSVEAYKLNDMTEMLLTKPYMFKAQSSDKYKKNQLAVLKKLFERTDIKEIVVCTDADAEGEAIGRDILTLNKQKNIPIFRLWNTGSFKSPDVIKEAFKKLLPLNDKKYENLYDQQRARATLDYIVGMKITKIITDTQGAVFQTGRLKALLISILAKRELDIKNFTPRPLWKIYANLNSLKIPHYYKDEDNNEVVSIYDESIMKEVLQICNENKNTGVITVLDNFETSSKERPLPLSGTDFANEMMKTFKIPLDTCSNILSFLREEGLTSYQGTNGRYFSVNDKDEVIMCIDVAKKYFAKEKIISTLKFDIKNSIFNDKKAEKQNHPPLTVREKIPNDALFKELEAKSKLPYLKEAYELVLKRVICNFLENDKLIKQKVVIAIKNKNFILEGSRAINQGWRSLIDMEIKDTTFDDSKFKIGDKIKFDSIKVEESTTTKPKLYTVQRFINMMLNVSKEINTLISETDDIEEKKRLEKIKKTLNNAEGIATDRTRPSLISDLKEFEYIDVKGKSEEISLLEKAWKIYDLLPAELKDFGLCASWENSFNDIRNGDLSYKLFIKEIDGRVCDMVEEIYKRNPISKEKRATGYTPKASGSSSSSKGKSSTSSSVVSTPKTYRLNEKFVFKTIFGKDLTVKEAEKILNGNVVELSRISTSTKEPYKIKVKLASSSDGKVEVVK